MPVDVDYVVVGGGVVGRAVAYALRKRGEQSVAVIERCPRDLIENQSTRNAGVIHAGVYYRPSIQPLKARLCVIGNRLLYDFCEEFGVPHARTGKLVVATCEREEPYLLDCLETARQNAVPDVRLIDAGEQRTIEPRIVSTKALLVPTSGVIDAAAYLDTLRRRAGCHDLFQTRVEGVRRLPHGFEVFTRSPAGTETFVARTVINAAGLESDDIARMIDPDSPYQLVAYRGESAKFYTTRRDELALRPLNVYPVPCGVYPDGRLADVSFEEFKTLLAQGTILETFGMHITPTLDEHGNASPTMTVGPAVTRGVAKDDFRSLAPPERYCGAVERFFPALQPADVELHHVGIQARVVGHRDWVIEPSPEAEQFINLIGINSPGLTSSLAIASYVVEELL
jgi:(S)-2-hydroxyglutarate dehydrogenase